MSFVPSVGSVIPTVDPAIGGRSVVYSPGNPAPADNEYVTWQAAYDAAAEPRSICVDDSFVSPAPIPAGTWVVNELKAATSRPVAVEAQAGCVINQLALLERVLLSGVSPAPVVNVGVGELLELRLGSSVDVQSTGAPLVQTGAGFCYIHVDAVAQVGFGLGVAVDVLGLLTLYVDSGGGVATGAIDSSTFAGICIAQKLNDGSYADAVQGAGLLYLLSNFGTADNVGYSPAVLPDWSGVAPTSIADALNRIAAALGPIP